MTRGRANTLRLVLSGQLGAVDLASDAVAETMALCVGCKACRRECPTGVDMARMKLEAQAARVAARGLSLRDRLVAFLPVYAPYARRLGPLVRLRNRTPWLAAMMQRVAGFAAERALPEWSSAPIRDGEVSGGAGERVVLFADTFSRWFEPENLRAAAALLRAAGFAPEVPRAGGRPLCCGRTFLAAGLIDRARQEARRTLAALAPAVRAGAPVIGLEPSCILTLRDEWTVLGLGAAAEAVAAAALPFESFVVRNARRVRAVLAPRAGEVAVHPHCHSKAHGFGEDVAAALGLIPGLAVRTIASSCCGMAGSFGLQAETASVSRAMAELTLLPAIWRADPGTILAANGTSCRHQIGELAARPALHPARVLAEALARR